MEKQKFEIREEIYLNDEKFKLISGAIHYFRVVPEYWRDRLEKLKNMGCNTVETYIAWNVHEPREGEFNFDGINDFEKFIDIAEELGLYVIVRPGPYICAEWEWGGFPYWLMNKPNIKVRTNNHEYLSAVEKYFDVILPKIAKRQITNGGPVIMVQIENEYGSFGNDKEYLSKLVDMNLKHNINVPLFTSDGPDDESLNAGTIYERGVIPTVNCGGHIDSAYETFKRNFPDVPFIIMEYWIGWFSAWEGKKLIDDPTYALIGLEPALKYGHVNFYMLHGGTNWGFMNGANYSTHLTPDTTSYDYSSPISENGDYGSKYEPFKQVIEKFVDVETVELSTQIKKCAYAPIEMVERATLFDNLDNISTLVVANETISFEELGHPYGYVLYSTNLGKITKGNVNLKGANDRALYYIDSKFMGVKYDKTIGDNVYFEAEKENKQLNILVENLGRVNFAHWIDSQSKGITKSINVNSKRMNNINHNLIDFSKVSNLEYGQTYERNEPTFSKFILNVSEQCDTYVDMSEFGKGCVILNGEVLGRFWNTGPQLRLYIPAPLLKVGENEIVVFETEGVKSNKLEFFETQKWINVDWNV